ncbi:MAG: class II fructose-bisphosphate aldolase [Desulfobacterales bacterium]
MPAPDIQSKTYQEALRVGRPPNVVRLFPESRALIVSGKYIDRAMLRKGQAVALAANGRSNFVLRGALLAAQDANAALIIEIARSEGGANAYCAVNFWNIARQVNAACNELGITVPVAIHADHYGIKKPEDIAPARVEIPTLFEAGMTSIAVDASHMRDDMNLLANIELNDSIPSWAGRETEVGEIKGEFGLSTPDDARFLIEGLNAHGIFPDWIALNNGTTHGIEASGQGIQVELTRRIHEVLSPFNVSGAQHGTSGNSTERLREIAGRTRTTKANVATALQMISWGLKVNDYGNAILDEHGEFIKVEGQGVDEAMWTRMTAFAREKGWSAGNYKKLNLPFENHLLGQPRAIRDRMVERVRAFAHDLIVNVFNSADTAPLVVDGILEAGSFDPGPKAERIASPDDWTPEKIRDKAAALEPDKGPAGNFDD